MPSFSDAESSRLGASAARSMVDRQRIETKYGSQFERMRSPFKDEVDGLYTEVRCSSLADRNVCPTAPILIFRFGSINMRQIRLHYAVASVRSYPCKT